VRNHKEAFDTNMVKTEQVAGRRIRDYLYVVIALQCGWTIPNLPLHDKPVSLANMQTHRRNRVFVCCSNPGCHRSW
jgi:hypothetical protein